MKFPVEKCECGLDLTTVPARIEHIDNTKSIGECPDCGRTYFMVREEGEVLPWELEPPAEPEPAPRRGRSRATEPEPPVEPTEPTETFPEETE